MEYRAPEYEYDQQPSESPAPRRNSENGLKIAIVILLVVLIVISVLYWKSVVVSDEDKAVLMEELDTLKSKSERLVVDLDGLKFDNDTLNRNLDIQRSKADSLMTSLKKERQLSVAQLRKYERELGTLRSTMQGFVRQIDSLNRLNKQLIGENLQYKRDINDLRIKTDVAVETAQELNHKVQRGSQIKVGKISVSALNKNNKDARNAKVTARLVVSFDLTANELAQPGERNVYVRIISPEGYDLQETQGTMFNFEGQSIPYAAARSVDYQGDNLPVSLYYNGSGLTTGKYTIYVYMDGTMISTTNIILK